MNCMTRFRYHIQILETQLNSTETLPFSSNTLVLQFLSQYLQSKGREGDFETLYNRARASRFLTHIFPFTSPNRQKVVNVRSRSQGQDDKNNEHFIRLVVINFHKLTHPRKKNIAKTKFHALENRKALLSLKNCIFLYKLEI